MNGLVLGYVPDSFEHARHADHTYAVDAKCRSNDVGNI